MKHAKRSALQRIFLAAGLLLLAAAAAVMIGWQWNIHAAQERSQAYVHTLRALIPQPQGAAPETRSDNTMPALSIDGTDFVGILEMPLHGSALPVCADWGAPSRYPCRFSGSIYDGSIQIGGTSQKGQYDFYRNISVGDQLFFTDMTGNRYSYTVSDLRYEEHADQAALSRKEADLTLFIKNIYAFEYIVIFCESAGS